MSKLIETFTNIVLAVSALIVAVLLVRQTVLRERVTVGSQELVDTQLQDSTLAALHGLFTRADAGTVKAVVFVDVECPFCAGYHETVSRIARELPNSSVEVAHFPLPQHRFARSGAVALECAREQGQLESLLSAAYGIQDSIGLLSWTGLAARVSIDTVALRSCLESGRPEATVERHLSVARLVGVRGTPTVIVGATKFARPPTVDDVASLVGRVERRN